MIHHSHYLADGYKIERDLALQNEKENILAES